MSGEEYKNGPGYRYKPQRKLKDLPFMAPSLKVVIGSGKVVWDSVSEDLGYVYDQSCYNEEGERQRKQGEQASLGIRASQVEKVIEFDKEIYCESCFQHGYGFKELRVKKDKIYCPSCGIGRPLRYGDQ